MANDICEKNWSPEIRRVKTNIRFLNVYLLHQKILTPHFWLCSAIKMYKVFNNFCAQMWVYRDIILDKFVYSSIGMELHILSACGPIHLIQETCSNACTANRLQRLICQTFNTIDITFAQSKERKTRLSRFIHLNVIGYLSSQLKKRFSEGRNDDKFVYTYST